MFFQRYYCVLATFSNCGELGESKPEPVEGWRRSEGVSY
jgi:hypothetical protein